MALSRTILAVLAAAAFFPRPAGAEASNWMREYVQQRQAAQIARVIGEEAARDFLASKNGRIVGGTVAVAGAWPAQVALLYDKPAQSNFDAQFCGGTLVHARFVVTAAHCSDFVVNNPGSVVVLAGTNTLSGSASTGRRAVKKITIHPSWNDVTFDFDIAVWELFAPVLGIVPAPMIFPSQQATLAAAGTSAFATGWGATSNNGPSSTRLRQVLVPINSQTACNRWNSYDGELTPRMLCAGSFQGGKDACQGDSGGPLWVRNASGQFKILAGVTSWGYACAARNFPGVYSRLAVLGTWARGVITNSGF